MIGFGNESPLSDEYMIYAMALGAILKHKQVMSQGEIHDLVHLAQLAIKMHGNNGAGIRRESTFYAFCSNEACNGVWIDRHWPQPRLRYGKECGYESVGRNNDLITICQQFGFLACFQH